MSAAAARAGSIAKCVAFLRRDCAIATSYRFQFAFHLASGVFTVLSFYFVAQLVGGQRAAELLGDYGTDYFSFTLIGVAATGFLQSGLVVFTERLRSGMTEGSLEMMFVSPTRPLTILAMPCLWTTVFEAGRAAVVLAVGVFALGADLSHANLGAAAVVAVCSVATYMVFGLFSASVILIIKRGDPINWAFANLATVLGGAYFPVEVMPKWLQGVAYALPMTHSFTALRATLLRGDGLADVLGPLFVLLGFVVVGLPLAALACRGAVAIAKRDGSLGTF